MRSDQFLQFDAQPIAADQAGAAEGEIEQAEHAPLVERAGEELQRVEPAGGEATADQGPDRRPDDDIGDEAHRLEFVQRADMRPAARRAGAEREADPRPGAPAAARCGLGFRLAEKIVRHGSSLAGRPRAPVSGEERRSRPIQGPRRSLRRRLSRVCRALAAKRGHMPSTRASRAPSAAGSTRR